jgi:hypothetical protein
MKCSQWFDLPVGKLPELGKILLLVLRQFESHLR